ncbi:MAG: hypothetical protein HQL32_00950 [Planctomycetes bacterium]|nr:hypothetical protein [Planctomycetota bacterium]
MKLVTFNRESLRRFKYLKLISFGMIIFIPLMMIVIFAASHSQAEAHNKKENTEQPNSLYNQILLQPPLNSTSLFNSSIFSGNSSDPFDLSIDNFLSGRSLFGRSGKLFEDAFSSPFFTTPLIRSAKSSMSTSFDPQISMEEKADGYYVKIRQSSASIGNINSEIKDGNLSLTIENEIQNEQTEDQDGRVSKSYSISKSTVSRNVFLGNDVDALGMTTEVVDGGVDIFIPKIFTK